MNKAIAIVCNYQLNTQRIGGMDRFFVAYDQALKKEGFTVDWFFFESEKHSFYNNLEVISGKGPIENIFSNYLRSRQKSYNIVITHFLALCTPFYKKLKKSGIEQIIAVDHNPRPLQGFSLRKKFKNKIKGRLYGKYIDCFVGVSQYTADSILKDYGLQLAPKTKVIYNGIDTSIYLKKIKENKGKFIVASHLRESKGLQDLFEGISLLAEDKRDIIDIDIFGEGPYERELKEKVKLYQIENQIRFRGSTSNLPRLFKNYSYMLQPTYMECFSLSILESLAANVPVLTTAVGGNLEIIQSGFNGFIFPVKDANAIKELLEKILSGSYFIETDVSKLIAEKFNLENMVENHLKVLSI